MKSTQNTFEAPRGKPMASITLSVSSRYSISEVALVQEALIIHRDSCMTLFLESIKQGEYSNAYGYYTSVVDISEILDEMLTKVTDIAENNYRAEQYALNPKAYSPIDSGTDNREGRYRSWLKEILPEGVSDEPEDEKLPETRKDYLNDHGLYPSDGTFLLDMKEVGATDEEVGRFAELLKQRNTRTQPTPAEQ